MGTLAAASASGDSFPDALLGRKVMLVMRGRPGRSMPCAQPCTRTLRSGSAAILGMNRLGEPDEVPRMLAILVSDAAAYVTGRTIFVVGGMTDYPSFIHGG